MTNVILAQPEQNDQPVKIAPENLLVAETYLRLGDINSTSQELSITREDVAEILRKREVQKFIDAVYMDTGYRNKAALGAALDKVIADKLEEMEEAEIASSKDIADLLALAHKFRMEELNYQLKLAELESKNRTVVGTQVNIQDNSGFGGNYGEFISRLIEKQK